ncbi:hypothetical protein HDE_01947 [Halotydeus destructor]|nr:hypothetical protein HDE_01947 [Halotydeus destructor]
MANRVPRTRITHGKTIEYNIQTGNFTAVSGHQAQHVFPCVHNNALEFHPLDEFAVDGNHWVVKCKESNEQFMYAFTPGGYVLELNFDWEVPPSPLVPQLPYARVDPTGQNVRYDFVTGQFRDQNGGRVYPFVRLPRKFLEFYATDRVVQIGTGQEMFLFDALNRQTLPDMHTYLASPNPVSVTVQAADINAQRRGKVEAANEGWLELPDNPEGFSANLGTRGRASSLVGTPMHNPYAPVKRPIDPHAHEVEAPWSEANLSSSPELPSFMKPGQRRIQPRPPKPKKTGWDAFVFGSDPSADSTESLEKYFKNQPMEQNIRDSNLEMSQPEGAVGGAPSPTPGTSAAGGPPSPTPSRGAVGGAPSPTPSPNRSRAGVVAGQQILAEALSRSRTRSRAASTDAETEAHLAHLNLSSTPSKRDRKSPGPSGQP